jgi:hypothetical protein
LQENPRGAGQLPGDAAKSAIVEGKCPFPYCRHGGEWHRLVECRSGIPAVEYPDGQDKIRLMPICLLCSLAAWEEAGEMGLYSFCLPEGTDL